MTVIRPNSVSGITSITAQANEINVFRSNGTLAGLNLNGVNFNTTAGISTLAALKITGNLDVAGVLTYQDVTNVDAIGIITARSDISIADKIIHTGDTNTAIRFPANDTISFETAGSEIVRINSSGHILKGHDAPSADLHDSQTTTGRSPRLQLHGANAVNAGAALISWKSGTGSYYSPNIYLARSGSDTIGTNALVANNAPLGAITFNGDDGGEFAKAAVILSEVDGTSGADNMPGRLIFKTTPSGTQVPVERLRITSTGQQQSHAGYAGVGINTFASWARTGGAIRAEVGYNAVTTDYMYFGTGTNHPLALRVNNSNALYIKNDANRSIGIGTDNPVAGAAGARLAVHFDDNTSYAGGTARGNGIIVYNRNAGGHSSLELAQRNSANTYGTVILNAVDPADGNDYGADFTIQTRVTGSGNYGERLRITSDGKVGMQVATPKSNLHVYGPGDIRIGSQYGGHASIAQQVQYSSGYTGVHWMFETNGQMSWCFDGVMIVHGSGGSSYGTEVTHIKLVYSRESGALDSGDTWRNGSSDYNIETLGHGQVGLAPSSGSFSYAEQTNPDGSSSTRSLFKFSWSASGQSVGVWSKLVGNFYWGSGTSGNVEIQDKDGNIVFNSI